MQTECGTQLYEPDVTVVVCAYKIGEGVRPTIDAILAQSHRNFKLIVVDDASGDGTADVVRSYTDSRLCLVENKGNLGIIASRNKGLGLVDTDFAATCDHDDVWHPNKLEKQVAYMRQHPKCNLVGTFWTVYVNGRFESVRDQMHSSSNFLKWRLFHKNCLLHSSLLMRMRPVKEHGIGYREGLKFADDWKLCFDFARTGDIGVIPESLVSYNIHGENWSLLAREKMLSKGIKHLTEELAVLFGVDLTKEEVCPFFYAVTDGKPVANQKELRAVGSMLKKVMDSAISSLNCDDLDKSYIELSASETWWRVIRTSAGVYGPGLLKNYTGPDYPNAKTIGMAEFLTEWLKACAKTLLIKAGLRPRE